MNFGYNPNVILFTHRRDSIRAISVSSMENNFYAIERFGKYIENVSAEIFIH